MRPTHRADLVGMRTSVGRGPADHLADLRLPVTVQHTHAELVDETARRERRQRRGDAAHVTERCEIFDVVGVVEHRDRRGWQHRGADAEPLHELRERGGSEAVHDHDRRARPQPEQHVVDAGVQRQRHRDQVRCGRPGGVAGIAAPQRTEHAIEQFEVGGVRVQDRLRAAGRARRPEHETHVVAVDAGVDEPLDAAGGDEARPARWRRAQSHARVRAAAGSPVRTRTPPPTRRTSSSPPSCRSAAALRPRRRVPRPRRRAVGRRPAPRARASPAVIDWIEVCSSGMSSTNGCSSTERRTRPTGRSSIDRDSTERNRSEPKGVCITWVGSRGVPSWWLCCCSPAHARRRHTTRHPPARPRRRRRYHDTSVAHDLPVARVVPHRRSPLARAPCGCLRAGGSMPKEPQACARVWRSRDSGRHWTRTGVHPARFVGGSATQVVVVNDRHLFVDFDGIVQESVDAGAHFRTVLHRTDARGRRASAARLGTVGLPGRPCAWLRRLARLALGGRGWVAAGPHPEESLDRTARRRTRNTCSSRRLPPRRSRSMAATPGAQSAFLARRHTKPT